MHAILWFIIGWFVLVTSFVAVMHAKLLREKDELSLFWKVNLLPAAVIGYFLDVAFNLVVGTILYREIPRELTFTERCRRHKDSSGSRGRIARWFCFQFGQIDSGHC